jgi:hypothetical protein
MMTNLNGTEIDNERSGDSKFINWTFTSLNGTKLIDAPHSRDGCLANAQ